MFVAVPVQIAAVVFAMLNTGGAGLIVTVVCWVIGLEQPVAATRNV